MYYQRLLSVYEKKVLQNRRKLKNMENHEKIALILVCLGVLAFFGCVVLWNVYNSTIYLFCAISCICIIMGSIFYSENNHRNFDEPKLEKYNEHLEKVKEILLDSQYKYYSLDCIGQIIEWCDKYAEEDDIWISNFRPFGVFFTIIFIPVSVVVLDAWISNPENGIEGMIKYSMAFVLVAFCIFLLWNALNGEMIEKINKKRKIARLFADDLRNLKLKEPGIKKTRNS